LSLGLKARPSNSSGPKPVNQNYSGQKYSKSSRQYLKDVERAQKMFRNPQNKKPANIIETGKVSTHAMRTVPHCSPVWLAAMVPAIPNRPITSVARGTVALPFVQSKSQ